MPPELIELFKDAPGFLAFLFLGAPFLVLVGVVITVIVTRVRDKGVQAVAEQNVSVSEKEAATHEFQAIIDGFSKSIGVISERADNAEKKAGVAEEKAEAAERELRELVRRVQQLEDERHDAIDHVILLESLIEYPPGPPPRPAWMQRTRHASDTGPPQ